MSGPNQTAHSEIGKLQKVFLKNIGAGFINQNKIDEEWRPLNYLKCPDFKKAKEEYQNFIEILKQNDTEILYFDQDDSTSIDSIYCRDASIVTDHGVILCQMGKQARKQEPLAQSKGFQKNGIPVIGSIESPGTLEGGDVAWLDKSTLAVAHGYRTNQSGFDQLQALLNPFEIKLVQVQLPHYKGPTDVFHLMSIFSPVEKNVAVVYSPLMPIAFRNLLLDKGYILVEVPDTEFESMGCNVLNLSLEKCMMVSGNPITKSRLEKTGCQVIEYQGEHISVLGGGGPTCLTRPLTRIVDF